MNQLLSKEADFLVAYSTTVGNTSFRSPKHGAWCISSLMEKLNMYGDNMHVLDILTKVNQEVSTFVAEDGLKQMPSHRLH